MTDGAAAAAIGVRELLSCGSKLPLIFYVCPVNQLRHRTELSGGGGAEERGPVQLEISQLFLILLEQNLHLVTILTNRMVHHSVTQ